MEEKLLKVFKLANLLNEKQDKVYAQITYFADYRRKLEIAIRSTGDFSYLEKCEIQLANNQLFRIDDIIKIFECYVGGVCNE